MAEVLTRRKNGEYTLINARIKGKTWDLAVRYGKIAGISPASEISPAGEIFDLEGLELRPGLFDIHSHGCMGFDTMEGHIPEMARFWAENGTTSWLPTTMTMDHESLLTALSNETEAFDGCNVPGFHMEGPYIADKYAGAQNRAFIRDPDLEEFKEFNKDGKVKLITLAPERAGSLDFIKNCGIPVAIGHTGADYKTASAAFDAGASNVTHTFNAMPGFHHREPSVIGAAIDKNAYAQAICDGLHLHRAAILMLYRTFGARRMVLISDAIRATGFADGSYSFGGQEMIVKDRVARILDGSLAGGTTPLFDCVRKAISFGIPKDDAFRMASKTPSELMGVKKGSLRVGYDAEFIAISDHNGDPKLEKTIILNK